MGVLTLKRRFGCSNALALEYEGSGGALSSLSKEGKNQNQAKQAAHSRMNLQIGMNHQGLATFREYWGLPLGWKVAGGKGPNPGVRPKLEEEDGYVPEEAR